MEFSKKELANLIGYGTERLMTYLCREEFAHIKLYRWGHNLTLKNVKEKDISRLIALKKVNRTTKRGYNGELCC